MTPLFDKPIGEKLFEDDLHWEVPEANEDELPAAAAKTHEEPPPQLIKKPTKTSLHTGQSAAGSRVGPETAATIQVKF